MNDIFKAKLEKDKEILRQLSEKLVIAQKLTDAEKQIEDLKTKRGTIKKLTNEKKELEGIVKELKAQVEGMQEQIEQVEGMQKQIAKLQQKTRSFKNTIARLESDNNLLTGNLSRAKREGYQVDASRQNGKKHREPQQ